MNIATRPCHNRTRRFSAYRLGLSLLLVLAGMALTAVPALAVEVDQQPLTSREAIPPNIVLMLDDSGSMNWDVMPDWDDLPIPNWDDYEDNLHRFNDEKAMMALINSKYNPLYYNPDTNYKIPPKADGTEYNTPTFTSAPVSGFLSNSATVNISRYRGRYDSNDTSYKGSSVQYSISVAKVDASTYEPTNDCSAADGKSNKYPGYCYYTNELDTSVTFNFYDKTAGSDGDFYISRCNDISDVYHNDNGLNSDFCTPGISFFTFAVGGFDSQTRHYVGANEGDCAAAGLSSDICVDPSQNTPNEVTDPTVPSGWDAADVMQNIAIWFSYYHNRMLMAKSGLMLAFSDMDEDYRLGFGSINGNNNGALPSNTTSKKSTKIANVEPFGNGSANTQKAEFWSWIDGIEGAHSTPLRQALQAVGEYYQTKEPWKSTNDAGDTEVLACRQSYVILTTDGMWNSGDPSNYLNNATNTEGPEITGPDGENFQYVPKDPFQDNFPNMDSANIENANEDVTLADIAMYYWNHDLRTNLANEVPTSNADPAFWQHMTTFTIGMGFLPVDKNGDPIDKSTRDLLFQWARTGTKPAGLSDWTGWPEPYESSVYNITDMVHAAITGHGGFFSATDPQSLITGLKEALRRAKKRTGSGASLAANSTQLKTGTTTYQALYHTSVWTGNLKAYAVDPSTGEVADTPEWTAADAMPAPSDRTIYTYSPKKDSMVVFSAANVNKLSTEQQNALNTGYTDAKNMVQYLRGDDTPNADGSSTIGWRSRSTPLGDIVNSQPVYVGGPNPNQFSGQNFTGSDKFSDYYSNTENRTPMIYVAANDGMLHAFNATSGKEIFAYLPGAVITSGITKLANPEYGTGTLPHQYFNDGQLTVADAYFNGSWHTVLVGTTGRSQAKTVYALDITDPHNPELLWEHSATAAYDDSGCANCDYIGQITGKPIIALVADGEWVVLIGNGYNSPQGTAALLQFELSTGELAVYTTDSTVTNNGLAAPAVWIGNITNGVSTVAYAGDLQGNVWKFTLGSTDTPQANKVFDTYDLDNDGDKQPITAGMLMGRNPETGDLWLFFGTGVALSKDDRSDTSVQTWYGLKVTGPNAVSPSTARSDLAERKIIAQKINDNGLNIRAVTLLSKAEPIDDKSGWYIDLVKPDGTKLGERMVTPNRFYGSLLIGTSRVPTSTDPCSPGGRGWIMAVMPFTGTNPQATFFDTNLDGVFDSDDLITLENGEIVPIAGIGFSALVNNPTFIGDVMQISTNLGEIETVPTSGGGGALKMTSWRELVSP